MIAYVKGTVAEIEEDHIVIETGGLGYQIHVSASTAQAVPDIGQEAKIYTYTLVREDAFLLYGFLTKDDLEIFKKCLTVNGIGPKGALAILSVMDADAFRLAILSGDAKAIAKAPGIGGKTAQRLILDLKDKISPEEITFSRAAVSAEEAAGQTAPGGAAREAVEALTALGYGQAEALRAVKAVPEAENMDVGEILKAALRNLF